MLDVKKALLDPSEVFKCPDDILHNRDLSRQQKIDILRRWEYDLRQLQVADDESMTAPKPEPVGLENVLKCLRELGAPADVERSAPTKQGGR
jgi:hypothetical protein